MTPSAVVRSELAPATPVPANTSLQVLLIDDAEADRRLLHAFLVAQGHRVQCAADGEEALARFDETNTDIVLMAVPVSGTDGPEVSRRIQARCRDRWVPVVLMSAPARSAMRCVHLRVGPTIT